MKFFGALRRSGALGGERVHDDRNFRGRIDPLFPADLDHDLALRRRISRHDWGQRRSIFDARSILECGRCTDDCRMRAQMSAKAVGGSSASPVGRRSGVQEDASRPGPAGGPFASTRAAVEWAAPLTEFSWRAKAEYHDVTRLGTSCGIPSGQTWTGHISDDESDHSAKVHRGQIGVQSGQTKRGQGEEWPCPSEMESAHLQVESAASRASCPRDMAEKHPFLSEMNL